MIDFDESGIDLAQRPSNTFVVVTLELCDCGVLSFCLSVCLSVCHSFILSVSTITHEYVNTRRQHRVGMGKK